MEKDKFCAACCFKLENNENNYLTCDKCHIKVHIDCLKLYHGLLDKPLKKMKYTNSIYENYFQDAPQRIQNHFLGYWRCFTCWVDIPPSQITCNFCGNKDGFFVKYKKYDNNNINVTSCISRTGIEDLLMTEIINKKNEANEANWAHLLCLNLNSDYKIRYDLENKYFLFDNESFLKNRMCKNCPGKFKMDIQCKKCFNFAAHSVCMKLSLTQDFICRICLPRKELVKKNKQNCEKYNAEQLCNLLEEVKEILAKTRNRHKIDKKKSRFNSNIIKENTNQEEPIEMTRIEEKTFCIEKFERETWSLSYKFPNVTIKDLMDSSKIESSTQPISFNSQNDLLEFINFEKDETLLINQDDKVHINESQNLKEHQNDNSNGTNNVSLIPKDERKRQASELIVKKQGLKKKKYLTIKTIDGILGKVKDGEYYTFKDFLKDNLKFYIFQCKSRAKKAIDLQPKWKAILNLYENNIIQFKKFEDGLIKHHMSRFNTLKKYRVLDDEFPSIPKGYRKYQELSDYKPAIDSPEFIEAINKKLISTKKHECDVNCECDNLSTLGPYHPESMKWKTNCPGRSCFMECDNSCGCDIYKCHNKYTSNESKKSLAQNLKEMPCYGIDFCTYSNLITALNADENNDQYSENARKFIEKKLLKAIHHQNNKRPWNMLDACEIIIEESKRSNKIYNSKDRKFAKILKKAIKFAPNIDPETFLIHSKGYGVICNSENGIPAHKFIAEYFGEMYTPWRWFEKQDAIKRYHKENQQRAKGKQKANVELPDFYNIMLERHKDDPTGYDILFVDPINKGNFTSRFSHSCNPNCATITIISNGKYLIGMYSLRPIEYGEELTFDYCSVTESEQEQAQALCLCGSKSCRIYYLSLQTSKSTKYINGYLEQNLCFLQRNQLVLKATRETLQEKDCQILEKYSIRDCVLNDCPNWLLKWITLILEYIQNERKAIYNERLKANISLYKDEAENSDLEKIANHEANLLEMDRVQNLIITVDKIKHVLNLIKKKSIENREIKRKSNRYTFEEMIPKEEPISLQNLELSNINSLDKSHDIMDIITKETISSYSKEDQDTVNKPYNGVNNRDKLLNNNILLNGEKVINQELSEVKPEISENVKDEASNTKQRMIPPNIKAMNIDIDLQNDDIDIQKQIDSNELIAPSIGINREEGNKDDLKYNEKMDLEINQDSKITEKSMNSNGAPKSKCIKSAGSKKQKKNEKPLFAKQQLNSEIHAQILPGINFDNHLLAFQPKSVFLQTLNPVPCEYRLNHIFQPNIIGIPTHFSNYIQALQISPYNQYNSYPDQYYNNFLMRNQYPVQNIHNSQHNPIYFQFGNNGFVFKELSTSLGDSMINASTFSNLLQNRDSQKKFDSREPEQKINPNKKLISKSKKREKALKIILSENQPICNSEVEKKNFYPQEKEINESNHVSSSQMEELSIKKGEMRPNSDIKESEATDLKSISGKGEYSICSRSRKEDSIDPYLQGPINIISIDEICEYLWKNPKSDWKSKVSISIMQDLFFMLRQSSDSKAHQIVQEIIEFDKKINLMLGNPKERLKELKKFYLLISKRIKSIEDSSIHTSALSDILYFYGFTFIYFTSYEYPCVASQKVSIRKCDIIHPKIYFNEEACKNINELEEVYDFSKLYSSSYILGQMCIWWKQTVDKPDASLSQERRGTLSYPHLSSSFLIITTQESKCTRREDNESMDKAINNEDDVQNEVKYLKNAKSLPKDKSRKFEYPYGDRNVWLDRLKKNPGTSWPLMNNAIISWSFKRTSKIYGTFLYDGIVLKDIIPDSVQLIIDTIDKSLEDKLKLFEDINAQYYNKNNTLISS